MCPRHFEVPESARKLMYKANCCLACGQGGEMFCCDTCPASYHLQCLDKVVQYTGATPLQRQGLENGVV